MQPQTRFDKAYVDEQTTKRKELSDNPSMAGGLPALKEQVAELIRILSLHTDGAS